MHHCLQVPEVVTLVCAELEAEERRKDLASFAATCRCLYPVAVEALWREVWTVKALLCAMDWGIPRSSGQTLQEYTKVSII